MGDKRKSLFSLLMFEIFGFVGAVKLAFKSLPRLMEQLLNVRATFKPVRDIILHWVPVVSRKSAPQTRAKRGQLVWEFWTRQLTRRNDAIVH